MNEQRRFGESDHEPLTEDDILKQALVVGTCTVALLALVPWVRRLMGGVR